MAKKNDGAKARMARLQNRREYDDCSCGDPSTTSCGTCGDHLCSDCKRDHNCLDEKPIEEKLAKE